MRQNGYFTKQVIFPCDGPGLHHTGLARNLTYRGALGEAGRTSDLPMAPSALRRPLIWGVDLVPLAAPGTHPGTLCLVVPDTLVCKGVGGG